MVDKTADKSAREEACISQGNRAKSRLFKVRNDEGQKSERDESDAMDKRDPESARRRLPGKKVHLRTDKSADKSA